MNLPRPLPRWVRQARVVLVKELVDSFRDKRALSSILLSILVGPLITAFMMNRIAATRPSTSSWWCRPTTPTTSARHAPPASR